MIRRLPSPVTRQAIDRSSNTTEHSHLTIQRTLTAPQNTKNWIVCLAEPFYQAPRIRYICFGLDELDVDLKSEIISSEKVPWCQDYYYY